MNRQNRNQSETNLARAIRSWTGEQPAAADGSAGTAALAQELMRHGMPMSFAARAAAVMVRDGIRADDRWTGPLSELADLGAAEDGIKMHRASMGGLDREVVVDIGRVYFDAVGDARALRHARAH